MVQMLDESMNGVTVEDLQIGLAEMSKHVVISEEQFFSVLATTEPFKRVDEITYSVRLEFENQSYLQALYVARQAAAAGHSVRVIVEHTHWSSRAQRDEYVRAYIEATASRPEFKALHDDASRYAEELEWMPSETTGSTKFRLDPNRWGTDVK
jgi:hypothetical protein